MTVAIAISTDTRPGGWKLEECGEELNDGRKLDMISFFFDIAAL